MGYKQEITGKIQEIFPESAQNAYISKEILSILRTFKTKYEPITPQKIFEHLYSEKDIFLITYGDSIRQPRQPSLETLLYFLESELGGMIGSVHLLPIYPYTSDDGFSVSDFRSVRKELGSWKHVQKIAESFAVMLDFPLNHMSASHTWFKRFLDDIPKYQNVAIAMDPQTDLSQVVRPRVTPLLTEYQKDDGSSTHYSCYARNSCSVYPQPLR